MHVEIYLNVDFSSSAEIKIPVRIQFQTFLNKIQIFRFPCCSTHEDLSIDLSIPNVGLIAIDKVKVFFQLFGTSQSTSQNSISNLKKKNQILGFPSCSSHEDLSTDVSITNVGLILTKPR